MRETTTYCLKAEEPNRIRSGKNYEGNNNTPPEGRGTE
jgi:hypothetical protein